MQLSRLKLALVIAAAAWLPLGCASSLPTSVATAPTPRHTEPPQRILFVGNSYLYYNDSLHNHLRRIAEELGPYEAGRYQYKSATIGGASLSQHPIERLIAPNSLGIDDPFDLVILQGGSGEVLTPKRRQAFRDTAIDINGKIKATGAQVALYMTHAYVKPHARFDPAMIDKIEQTYIPTASAIDAQVIPVGLAFERAYDLRPDIVLHKPFDGSHPSLLGTYLAACVVYATLYGNDVSGMEYDYYGKIDRQSARFLQQVADDTVRDFLDR